MKMHFVLEAVDQVAVVHLAAQRLAGWLWLLAGWLGRGAGVQGCSGAGERAGLDVPNREIAELASERPNVGFAQVPWHGWPAPILNQHSQRELSRWQGRQFVKPNSLSQFVASSFAVLCSISNIAAAARLEVRQTVHRKDACSATCFLEPMAILNNAYSGETV